MVLETGQHPSALREQVTSPGGTTIEGLHELEKGKLHDVLMNAVRAATEEIEEAGDNRESLNCDIGLSCRFPRFQRCDAV